MRVYLTLRYSGNARPYAHVFSPDRQLLVPALSLVGLTTLLCGVAPALRSSKMDLVAGLRKGGSGATGRINLRSAFIMGQVALSLTLLVVSSLCLRSQLRIVGLDLGFNLDHGVVTRFNVEPLRGPLAARLAFADRVVERVQQIPGVQSAAVTALVPLGGDALVARWLA